MPKKSKTIWWRIYRVGGAQAASIGTVQAPNPEAAIKVAIKEYELDPREVSRLMAFQHSA